jgi:hypothetical protein
MAAMMQMKKIDIAIYKRPMQSNFSIVSVCFFILNECFAVLKPGLHNRGKPGFAFGAIN